MSNVYQELFDTILSRKTDPQEGSYTAYLFDKGLDKILKKVGEECAEVIIASKNDDKSLIVGEVADLLYHVFVLMAERDVPLSDLEAELSARAEKTGNLKQMKVVDKNT